MDLFGNKTGIVCGSRQFTFREFGERAQRLATGLVKLGVQPGDRVAYISFNTHKLLEGYYGVVQARAIVMPLNVRLSAPEMVNILNHSGARIVMYEDDFGPTVETLRAECQDVERWVALDGAAYEEIIASGEPERADIFSYDENSIAELFYTSGSTGTPKGVSLSTGPFTCTPSISRPSTPIPTRSSTCTRSPCFTPTAGDVRRPRPCSASNR